MGKFTQEDFVRMQKSPQAPVLKADLTGKVVIVVGANSGLGFEAAKHFATMNPAKLILTSRDKAKGDAALKTLVEDTKFDRATCWLLDVCDFASVKAFADKADHELERIDLLIENAGMVSHNYTVTKEGWQTAIQTNNLGLEMLALLLLPKLINTAGQFSTVPRLVVVSSDVHSRINMNEELFQSTNIHKKLSDKEYCSRPQSMEDMYPMSKLFNVFFVRSLATALAKSNSSIVVNAISPGFCYSGLIREVRLEDPAKWEAMERDLGLTTEEGSRHIVFGAVKGLGSRKEEELRGQYITMSQVSEPSDFVLSDAGKVIAERIWSEMIEILGAVDERVPQIVKKYLA